MSAYSDPLRSHRETRGTLKCPFNGEEITMLLRHADVRRAAKDWQVFSSDAPFRVPIPSEEAVRGVRQLPIETDPPLHAEYRKIVEPFFQRAKLPQVVAKVEQLIARYVVAALAQSGSVEVVNAFALPIQSLALTYLLNTAESEAETWIGWGIHVFKVTGGEFKEGSVLDAYLEEKFNAAEAEPSEDFFSALVQAEFQGRKLTRAECLGFANLAFAGGRDTIIHSISCVLGYFAEHPQELDWLREDPKRLVHASEEFFRVFMPLTHIGRVCPKEAEIAGAVVPAGERISLCWSSANFDETVFPDSLAVKLDRKPNPHLSFGFGTHLCLGAPHARLLLRTLLQVLCEKVARVHLVASSERTEQEAAFSRKLGYHSLNLRFEPLATFAGNPVT